jgi:hypothetical protein
MTVKINTGKKLKNLLGEVLQDELGGDMTVGRGIASLLIAKGNKHIDNVKSWSLAMKMSEANEVEVDESDFISIKRMLADDRETSSMITGQIRLYIESIKLESEKEADKQDK